MESLCIILQQDQIIQKNVQAQDQFLGLIQEKIFNKDATEGMSLVKQIVQSCELLVNLREINVSNEKVDLKSIPLGISYCFLQQNLKIQFLQQNIFSKNKNQGLEIFYILLAAFKQEDERDQLDNKNKNQEDQKFEKDELLQQIIKNLPDSMKYIVSFANKHHANKIQYEEDLQKWSYFKKLLNLFSQEKQLWILKNLTFVLIDILKNSEILQEKEKELPQKLDQQTDDQNLEGVSDMSTWSGFFDSNLIQANQYTLINLDKTIFDQINICDVQSFKINDNKQQGTSIYLYIQITQMIFNKFEKMYKKLMIKENRQTTKICFLLMPNRSRSEINHLSEFLRDAFNDIIESKFEKQNQQQDMNQINGKFNEETFNKFACQQLTTKVVREQFKTDERFNYFTYQGKQYELENFEKDNRVIIPERMQKQIILANLKKYPLISNDQNSPQEKVLINPQQQKNIIRSINSQLLQLLENGQYLIQLSDELQNQLLQQSNKSFYTLIPNKSILSDVEYVNSFIQNIKNFKMEDSQAIWKDPHYLQPARNIVITHKIE